jgi:hypothetical protein
LVGSMIRKLTSGAVAGRQPETVPGGPPAPIELGEVGLDAGRRRAGQAPPDASEQSILADGCALVQEMDKPLAAPAAILVPHIASLKQGSPLVGQVVLGRMLGAGEEPNSPPTHASPVLLSFNRVGISACCLAGQACRRACLSWCMQRAAPPARLLK